MFDQGFRAIRGQRLEFRVPDKLLQNFWIGVLSDRDGNPHRFFTPRLIKQIFEPDFTNGLHHPASRIRESEWRMGCVRLRDSIFYCPYCSLENFYDSDKLKATGQPGLCWSCATELQLPPRIRIGKNTVMLNYDTRLFPHHIDDGRLYDFSQPVAAVAQHPTNKNIWGIKNLTREKWVSTAPDGRVKDVEPGLSITLSPGTKILFGKTQGEIRA